MDIKTIESAVEAILFASGEAVPLSFISNALEVDRQTLKKIINNMAQRYKEEKRGINILELEDSYQMVSSPLYYDYISRVLIPKRRQQLSSAALETLSIIAYNQPITKAKIEYIRGVDCTGSINKLLERNLIEEAGRLNTAGKPILYKTTLEFLKAFGLRSLNDLPPIDNPFLAADEEAT
ncbi:MAG: SMC-Scp complex subunit ScpB [Clostridiaceae bacterium]|nr:SMC-Scp complex subunit ScpB [Clostridiaceae bacterium]